MASTSAPESRLRSSRRKAVTRPPREASISSRAPSSVSTKKVRSAPSASSAALTLELHAIDDGDDGGVNGRVRDGDARGVPERDEHVVARPRVEQVGAHD